MVLFTVLTIILLLLIAFVVAVVSVGGTAFIVIFGDVIVCIFIIVWILGKILKSRKK